LFYTAALQESNEPPEMFQIIVFDCLFICLKIIERADLDPTRLKRESKGKKGFANNLSN
jgi:hypothetical protein